MSGPLASLKILDFTTLLPGPYATLMLADLGAEVIRIESPTRPDLVRVMPPWVDGQSAVHGYLNRNKRALALDLKQPGAVEVVQRLVHEHDIVIEQFRPGVMDRLGVGYEALRAINPRLIYCSITGYGQTGPYRDRAGHDLNYLALSGMLSSNGRRQQGPAPCTFQIADVAGGSCHAVMAILAAVIHRQLTGEGQYIDISMTDAALALQPFTAPAALVAAQDIGLEEGQLNGGSFYDCYATRDGRWLSVAGLEPQFFSAFCEAIGRPHLRDRGLVMDPAVVAEVKREIAEALRERTLEQWCEVFDGVDACVEPVLTLTEALRHPHHQARGNVVQVPSAAGGSQPQVASPFRLSATPPEYRFAGVPVGTHTEAILSEIGLTGEQVAQLKAGKAVQ